MKQQRKEDAVSPVIGVMLMLVVTIIIAAVITGFSMDLSKGTSSTPMALFDIDYDGDTEVARIGDEYVTVVKSFGFTHKGG
ncbi:MAG: type IV pilin N-terminal domain-containing protein, partial [Methanocorpusculaceae archaeon]|nr:type IV pilin N-terminal domain-containing protein [Methanocorpusculaceae archaeon]